MAKQTDAAGNLWYKQEEQEHKINHGVRGAHASLPFQCEDCWILNLEGRLPIRGLDTTYIMLIRRVNLDIINGRARATLEGHANSVKRTVRNCQRFGKTPSIPARGPMPVRDTIGMGLAVEMVDLSLVAKGRINKEGFIQYDTMRKPRASYSKCWESSPVGVVEGSSFGKGVNKSIMTACPSQSATFSLFCIGSETRMGVQSEADKPLHIKTVVTLLNMIKDEANEQSGPEARELWKVGAAIAVAQMGSLQGPEVFMLDLAGIRSHIEEGKEGTMPLAPLDDGVDLFDAPHVYLAMVGNFKGETGVREHLVAVASESKSGINVRWWLEKLIHVREEENCINGPAFGDTQGEVARQRDYNEVLRHFLSLLRDDPNCNLIMNDDDIHKNYSFFRTFRKTAEGRARAAGLDSDIQNAMNRWRKVERAKGRRPKFSMVDHYSTVRDLMPVTWRYSYVQ